MAERFLALVLHAGSAVIMAMGYKGLETTILDTYIRGQKGGHSQFLTIQAYVSLSSFQSLNLTLNSSIGGCRLLIAWLTMIFGVVADIFPGLQGWALV